MTYVIGLSLGLGLLVAAQAVMHPQAWRPRWPQRSQPNVAPALWPDVVDDLVASVVAGISLPQAFAHIAQRGPVPVRRPFAAALDVHERTGDFAKALDTLRATVDDPVADTFCAALSVAHRVGGRDLGRVLRGLSEVLREDIRVRGELAARQSWTVSGARIAVAAPWVTVLLLSSRHDAAEVYRSAAGLRLLCGCAVVTAAAYAAMRAIGRLPEGARL